MAWHRAFLDVGKEVPCWRILGLIGRAGSELVRILLGDQLADAQGSHVEKLHTRYFVDSAPALRALPGARELLEAMAELGWRAVLATSAGEEELSVLREALDADDLIRAVTSAADAERAKPHPDVVVSALQRIDADPAEAVMLGDTVWDVHAGRRAGVPTAAVLSGGIGREALENAGAAAIYAGPLEVRAHLEEFSQLLRL
ncbi:HAD family hydrolase [Candidatus Mycobacterium methanotrophicum]|uniref:HAD family hydrolase n=1 Tax=Candidatus Mycobacterium methanotrophicum TaxID=2943498 RepID=A0ABY4QJ71_9MYCO|nr:HAD family hydrolase [Candidatus Mycobacterium methanotrophicum]UQX09730.1 HAD family hydrolase [Candidatus Mycobacterium methanotrophicum]